MGSIAVGMCLQFSILDCFSSIWKMTILLSYEHWKFFTCTIIYSLSLPVLLCVSAKISIWGRGGGAFFWQKSKKKKKKNGIEELL